ncbi:MAG: GNAT family N-acetyltransferase [Acidimicrobiales bacterium]
MPSSAHFIVRPLAESDRDEWRRLWTGYLEFYESTVPEEVYQATFDRLLSDDPWMPSAFVADTGKDRLIGLVHYLFHSHCWRIERECYLQDLFTDPNQRGSGVGRALIEAVYDQADRAGGGNVYWLTQEFNQTARGLYDRIATVTPFIKYARQ